METETKKQQRFSFALETRLKNGLLLRKINNKDTMVKKTILESDYFNNPLFSFFTLIRMRKEQRHAIAEGG